MSLVNVFEQSEELSRHRNGSIIRTFCLTLSNRTIKLDEISSVMSEFETNEIK